MIEYNVFSMVACMVARDSDENLKEKSTQRWPIFPEMAAAQSTGCDPNSVGLHLDDGNQWNSFLRDF